MNILVTGGAGYIGSHTAHELVNQGYNVIIIDNLELGHIQAIPKNSKFYNIDLKDTNKVNKILEKNKIKAILHFAGYSQVGESMKNPIKYYNNNITSGISLLKAALKNNIKKFIFSSTAATYGEPKTMPIAEDTRKNPTNHYGKSKLFFENILHSCKLYELKSISLRYFNAAGADHGIGEDHNPETHLIPLILQVALNKRKNITIFGNNYPTKDGTCIRDYIHITDLATAHIKALEALENTNETTFNLGNSKGYSVKEIIEECRKVTGHEIPTIIGERREGDPPKLIASNEKAKKILNWEPRFNLNKIIKSAWEWHSTHPNGFEK